MTTKTREEELEDQITRLKAHIIDVEDHLARYKARINKLLDDAAIKQPVVWHEAAPPKSNREYVGMICDVEPGPPKTNIEARLEQLEASHNTLRNDLQTAINRHLLGSLG